MKNICLVFGGESGEHDISIITGMQLYKNVSNVIAMKKIYLGLDNRFYLADKIEDLSYFADKEKIKLKEVYFSNGALYTFGKIKHKICEVECVINCCHGGVGENGNLSAYFEINKIKTTNANVLSSHIAMDKFLCKQILNTCVPCVKGVKVTKANFEKQAQFIKDNFKDNLIVKPNSLGSSLGVKVCDKTNFEKHIEAVFALEDDALVEERVENLCEFNQACFKTKDGLILSAIEQPLTKSEFLTFDDKYNSKTKCKHKDRILPAKIAPELEEKIIDYTSKIYNELNMSGVVRIDYLYDQKTNELYFNEINTIPGSMAYYLFEEVGIDYITLVRELLDNADEIKKNLYFDSSILRIKLI